jgi:hypothetical protein
MISKKDPPDTKHLCQPRVDTYETNKMQMQDGGPMTSHDLYQLRNCRPIECCGRRKDFKRNVRQLKKTCDVIWRLSFEAKHTLPPSLA